MSNHDKHYKTTLYDWCIENDRKEIIDLWDEKLNSKTPHEVGKCSTQIFYLKCLLGIHPSEPFQPNNYTRRNNLHIFCHWCNSFAQSGINLIGNDFLDRYWDYELNGTLNPWDLSRGNNQSVIWIKCDKKSNHGSFQSLCSTFLNSLMDGNNGCPYCKGFKIKPEDSFGQYCIDNIDPDFISKYWGTQNVKSPFEYAPNSNEKVFIKCQLKDYHPEYDITCSNFLMNRRCPYCTNHHGKVHPLDSLGTLFPKSVNLWSDKNKKSPYEYSPSSAKKVYWKCEDGLHEDYCRTVYVSSKLDFRCPTCSSIKPTSILQDKVSEYITNKYPLYTLNHELACSLVPQNPKTHFRLPLDNLIEDIKLVIEVHGGQHYRMSGFNRLHAIRNKTTAEYEFYKTQLHDRYKKFVAYCRGYFYLEIPYTAEKDESYKTLIDQKIASITK